MKPSVAYEELQGQVLFNFADMCGWALARAHSKSGDAARLSGYLGRSNRMDRAIAKFAHAYADQYERDFAVFKQAIRDGKFDVKVDDAQPKPTAK